MKDKITLLNFLKKKQTYCSVNLEKNKNSISIFFLNKKILKNNLNKAHKLKKNKIFNERSFKNKKNFKKKKNFKIKKLHNSYLFIFIRKLFNSFIKGGKKMLSINYFLKIMFFICMKFNKFGNRIKKTKFLLLYFNQILNNIVPVFIYTNLMFKGKNILLPWLNKNTKQNKIKILRICVSWTKKSICKRKEKTIFFKILSELEDIRNNKGETVLNKKNYYLEFYKNKYYINFLKSRNWT